MNAIITMQNADISAITDNKLKECTQVILNAVNELDKNLGLVAVHMHYVRQMFSATKDGISGYKNFAAYAEKCIGVKKAQAYNLSNAGAYMKLYYVRSGQFSVNKCYTDKWTFKKLGLETAIRIEDGTYKGAIYDEPVKGFSNTTLAAFTRFCYQNGKLNEDKESQLEEYISDGTINTDMTVSAIEAILFPRTIKTTATDNKPQSNQLDSNGQDADSNGQDADSNGQDADNNNDKLDSMMISVPMSKDTARAIKVELLNLWTLHRQTNETDTKDAYPALTAIYNIISQKL